MITFEEIRQNEEINTYIKKADESLAALGYTEHSFAHVGIVAESCGYILSTLGYPEREVELGRIAAYLHQRTLAIIREQHLVLVKGPADLFLQGRVILHDQQWTGFFCTHAISKRCTSDSLRTSNRGKTMLTRVPTSRTLSTSMRPPNSCTY